MCDARGVYHFDPRGGRVIGRLCREFGGTLLVSTPDSLAACLRRCETEDFATLDAVVTGGEKLPTDLADAFQQKFGIRPVEGYWAAELSSLVSVNIPPRRMLAESEAGSKEGTVGLPVPGVAAKIVSPATGEELGAGQSGLLLVTGPNVMKGYLDREDLTAQVMRDGWYVTGDIAHIDEDGFLRIP